MNLSFTYEQHKYDMVVKSRGRSRIVLDGKPIYHDEIKKTAILYTIDGEAYEMEVTLKLVLGLICIEIKKCGVVVSKQWYSRTGKELSTKQVNYSWVAYLFASLCAVVAIDGGPIPIALALLGVLVSIVVFTSSRLNFVSKFFCCLTVTVCCWSFAGVLSGSIIELTQKFYAHNLESYIEKAAKEANRKCPHDIDEFVCFDSVTSSSDTLEYHYTMKKNCASDFDEVRFAATARDNGLKELQEEAFFKFISKSGGKVSLHYQGKDGNTITTITLSAKDVKQ